MFIDVHAFIWKKIVDTFALKDKMQGCQQMKQSNLRTTNYRDHDQARKKYKYLRSVLRRNGEYDTEI